MSGKEILDIEDLQFEYSKLKQRSKILSDRFQALNLDFKYNSSIEFQKLLFKITNDVFFRINSASFHIKLLLDYYESKPKSGDDLIDIAKPENLDDPILQNARVQNFFNFSSQEASSLFDSVIYHITTLFDYMGCMINLIYNLTGTKEQSLKWSALNRTSRDSDKKFHNFNAGKIVRDLNNDFVEPLYKYRSILIHNRSDICSISMTLRNQEPSIIFRFLATPFLCKSFYPLRKLNQENELTLRYSVFWLINRTYDAINEMLFSIKKDFDTNNLKYSRIDKKIVNEFSSSNYWHESDKL